MKKAKRAGKLIALATAAITLATACVYLAIGAGAGQRVQCTAANSCAKTEVRECRHCRLLPSTISGPLGTMPGRPCRGSGRP
jgi:hypothetical protein